MMVWAKHHLLGYSGPVCKEEVSKSSENGAVVQYGRLVGLGEYVRW